MNNMKLCRVCMKELEGDLRSHPSCLRKLFGTPNEPVISLSLSEITAKARDMAGKISISGVQPKLSMARKGRSVVPVFSGGLFILKPQTQTFENLPENEHLCMCIAEEMEISVPPNGLFELEDESKAYLVRRFDRTAKGQKKRCEDFAQILGQDKYSGSVERIGRRLMELSEYPGLNAQLFLERVLLFFLIGNGDAHLKNYSMLETPEGTFHLSPAYDIVCSKLVIPEEEDSALSINGKRNKLVRRDFDALAANLKIPKKACDDILERFEAGRTSVEKKIGISCLPTESRDRLSVIVRERFDRLFK